MRIVACIKQVPDTAEAKVDPETGTLKREGVKSILNPFDEFALEEALRIKERVGDGETVAITMGPPQAEEVLRYALAMGIDRAVLVSDRAFAGSDTLATSYVLSKAIKKLGDVDMVICGRQAIDGDTGQVGPGLATRLGFSQITYVSKVEEVDPKGGRIVVERLLEDGKELVEARLPSLITVLKDINQPRYPTIIMIRKAQKAQITVWGKDDLECEDGKIGLDGSPTKVLRIFTPEVKKHVETIKGDPSELAKRIADRILELNVVK